MGAIERDLPDPLVQPKTYGDILGLVERAKGFREFADDPGAQEELGRIERFVRLAVGLPPRGEEPIPEILERPLSWNDDAMYRARFAQLGIAI